MGASPENTSNHHEIEDVKQLNVGDQSSNKMNFNTKSEIGFFQINKKMISLKVTQFFIAGIAAAVNSFVGIYLVQIGLHIEQITVIYTIAAVVAVLGHAASGVIAEKTGHPKGVLFANLFIATVSVNLFFILPYMKQDTLLHSTVTLNSTRCSVNQTLEAETFTPSKSNQSIFIYCDSELNIHYAQEVKYHMYKNNSTKEYLSSRFISSNHDVSNTLLFIVCMVITVCFKASAMICFMFMDTISMTMTRQHNGDYGKQRFCVCSGVIIFPPLVGWTIQAFAGQVENNYSLAFVAFDVVVLIVVISIYKLDVEGHPQRRGFGKKFLKLFKSIELLVIVIVVTIFSINFGFNRDILFIYLNWLDASSLLIGLVNTMYGLVGLPFLFFSNWWLNRFSNDTIIISAFVAFTVYYVGLAVMVNPWWAILLETTSSVHSHLMWISVALHSKEMAPQALRSAVQILLVTIYFGFSRISGTIVGGFLMDAYGGRAACQALAVISFVGGLLYLCYVFLRRRWIANKQTYDVESWKPARKATETIATPAIYRITNPETLH